MAENEIGPQLLALGPGDLAAFYKAAGRGACFVSLHSSSTSYLHHIHPSTPHICPVTHV